MGAVYAVRDTHTGDHIALKRLLLSPDEADPHALDAFSHEFHTLSSLHHPRIIRVFDYRVDERGPYYTMELLKGEPLGKLIECEWREACALLRDVASSLAILHSRRIVHRDITLHNVYRTEDGRAKVLDFGSMTNMRVPPLIVGTPPYVPREALLRQPLDGRTDLYALGALAYCLLTGSHAYHARDFRSLPQVWRHSPEPPHALRPEIPEALSALIMQLLSLDAEVRPSSAAEVMERLSAIAELPVDEAETVSLSYLAQPSLVARDEGLEQARAVLTRLTEGEGSGLVVSGPPRGGRSRLLDAIDLEAKLLGVRVLRVDARDHGQTSFALARALFEQSRPHAPGGAEAALESEIDELLAQVDRELDFASIPARARLQSLLRAWFLAMAADDALLLSVDDGDVADGPSQALLADFAGAEDGKRVAVAMTLTSKRRRSELTPPLKLLRERATMIDAGPLSADATYRLLESIFGAAANLDIVAHRLHGASEGLPGICMSLARHLVNQGTARYGSGSWTLPAKLDESDLPGDLAEMLLVRARALGEPARLVATAVALLEDHVPPTEGLLDVLPEPEPAQLHQALDMLVAESVLISRDGRYRLAQDSWRSVLERSLDGEKMQALQRRLASVAKAQGAGPVQVARFQLAGGQEREAVADLVAFYDDRHRSRHSRPQQDPSGDRRPDSAVLRHAIPVTERLGVPLREVYVLRRELVASFAMSDGMRLPVDEVKLLLARLKQDSGLTDYLGLEGSPEERLGPALTAAQERYEQTPLQERVLSVFEAIEQLAELHTFVTSAVAASYDNDLIAVLPSLEPFLALSPAIPVVQALFDATHDLIQGRIQRAYDAYGEIAGRLENEDRAGLDVERHHYATMGVHLALGLVDAAGGLDSATAHADALHGDPLHGINAERLRMLHALSLGDRAAAERHRKGAEQILLRNGALQAHAGAHLHTQLHLMTWTGNLIGLKRTLQEIEPQARLQRGWRPFMSWGKGALAGARGDVAGALRHFEHALRSTRAGEHLVWPECAAGRVQCLVQLGAFDKALRVGREYQKACHGGDIDPLGDLVDMQVALAAAKAGDAAQDIARLEALIAERRAFGSKGLIMGMLHEYRARVALELGDRGGFDAHAAQSGEEYRRVEDSWLAHRHDLLMRDAGHDGGAVILGGAGSHQMPTVRSMGVGAGTSSWEARLESTLRSCSTGGERTLAALKVLCEATESPAGYLFEADGRELRVLASHPGNEPPDPIFSEVREFAKRVTQTGRTGEEEDEEETTDTTASTMTTADTGNTGDTGDAGGPSLCTLPVMIKHPGGRRLAAVIALECHDVRYIGEAYALASAVGDALFSDVTRVL